MTVFPRIFIIWICCGFLTFTLSAQQTDSNESSDQIDHLWLNLISFEQVWKELELSDEQTESLKAYVAEKRDLLRIAYDQTSRLAVLLAGSDVIPDDAKQILLPHQWKRISQIELQARVLSHLSSFGLLHPLIVKHVELNSSQKLELGKLVSEFDREKRKARDEHQRRIAKIASDLVEELVAELTMEQREKYSALLGDVALAKFKN